jgi:hypothetical protein
LSESESRSVTGTASLSRSVTFSQSGSESLSESESRSVTGTASLSRSVTFRESGSESLTICLRRVPCVARVYHGEMGREGEGEHAVRPVASGGEKLEMVGRESRQVVRGSNDGSGHTLARVS